VESCFCDDSDIAISQEKLRILLPPFALDTAGAESLLRALQQPGTLLSGLAKWFTEVTLAEWEKIPAFLQLSWIAGLTKGLEHLSFEQVVDLLRYPSSSLRQAAAQESLKMLSGKVTHQELSFFASGNVEFSRDQVITYLTLIDAKGDQREQLIDAFLKSKPPVQTLAELLSWRGKGYDLGVQTNVRLAEYLQQGEWIPSRALLTRFLNLPEPLFRAIAYSKLDVQNKEEREILKQFAEKESSPGLKVRVLEKLQLQQPAEEMVEIEMKEEAQRKEVPPVPQILQRKK
jgi:hypothetical protein